MLEGEILSALFDEVTETSSDVEFEREVKDAA